MLFTGMINAYNPPSVTKRCNLPDDVSVRLPYLKYRYDHKISRAFPSFLPEGGSECLLYLRYVSCHLCLLCPVFRSSKILVKCAMIPRGYRAVPHCLSNKSGFSSIHRVTNFSC